MPEIKREMLNKCENAKYKMQEILETQKMSSYGPVWKCRMKKCGADVRIQRIGYMGKCKNAKNI